MRMIRIVWLYLICLALQICQGSASGVDSGSTSPYISPLVVESLSSNFVGEDRLHHHRCYTVRLENRSLEKISLRAEVFLSEENKILPLLIEKRDAVTTKKCTYRPTFHQDQSLNRGGMAAFDILVKEEVIKKLQQSNSELVLRIVGKSNNNEYYARLSAIPTEKKLDFRNQTRIIAWFAVIFASITTLISCKIAFSNENVAKAQIKLASINFGSDWIITSALISSITPVLTNFAGENKILQSIAEMNGLGYFALLAMAGIIYGVYTQIKSNKNETFGSKYVYIAIAALVQVGIYGSFGNLCLYLLELPDYSKYNVPYISIPLVCIMYIVAIATPIAIGIKIYSEMRKDESSPEKVSFF